MRIGLLTSQYPGVRMGGIGGYTVSVARMLAQSGHEVHVFGPELPAESHAEAPLKGAGSALKGASRTAEGCLKASEGCLKDDENCLSDAVLGAPIYHEV